MKRQRRRKKTKNLNAVHMNASKNSCMFIARSIFVYTTRIAVNVHTKRHSVYSVVRWLLDETVVRVSLSLISVDIVFLSFLFINSLSAHFHSILRCRPIEPNSCLHLKISIATKSVFSVGMSEICVLFPMSERVRTDSMWNACVS